MRARLLLTVVVVAALGGGGFFLYSQQHGRAAQAPAADRAAKAVPVTVTAVEQKPAPLQIRTVGRVQTLASVAVRSRIDGLIANVAVTDGQEVKAGDELFRIDDREAQAALKLAQANLGKDQASLSNAKRQVDRLTPLAAKNFTTKQDYDAATTLVETLQATMAANQAAIDAAKVTLSYTVIRAPISGRIGTVALKLGNSVRAADSTPLVTINQLQPILVAFSIPQESMGELQRALAVGKVPVTATIPDSTVPVQQGEVSYVENAIDPATNTLSVKAQFPNTDEFLWPSQFVNVVMTIRVDPNAIVVPAAAIQLNQDGSYAWLVKPDATVEMRRVKVARQIGNEMVIEGDLKPGDQVVTEGQLRLENGTKVEVTGTAAPEADATTPSTSVSVGQ
ncbi:efflux RND transporter periplasmic adaptor subunit [Dongia sedimenti]|uniref:Efflux RND transporter periplasmic adaptor subunit n=1 Tax=Dongia sedimenti TaxID=3064282 RepID=A0ABU0YII7_9PROT|nr:efflux RND transporter periplasmic adaptor subunit [Rhodospirillaceae bacterium R-7]